MAKKIEVLAQSGQTIEICPHGNVYPAGAVTLSETSTECGDLVVYGNDSVSDDFDINGRADIYINGFFQKTLFYDADLALGNDW